MAWMQCSIPASEPSISVHTALYGCTLQEARAGGINHRVALFTREADHRLILLLSPDAAEYAGRLPGSWSPADHPEAHHWDLGYSAGVTAKELGLH